MSDLKPCTFTAGKYVIGFDPGRGDKFAATTVMERLPNGKMIVVSSERFEIKRGPVAKRTMIAEVIPIHFMRECRVCDQDRVVVVSTGPQADFIDCPACIGVERDALTSSEVEDVEAMCKAENRVVRWL